jgi:hypothetical protein
MKRVSWISEQYLLPVRYERRQRLRALLARMIAVTVFVVGALLVLHMGVALAVPPGDQARGQHFTLMPDAKAMWINSGVWEAGATDNLLLIDALNSLTRKFHVDYSSHQVKEVGTVLSPKGSLNFEKPASIASIGTSYLLASNNTRFVRLSGDLKAVSSVDIGESADRLVGQIGSVYAWAPLSDNVLLMFGDVLLPNGMWISAFLRVPLNNPTGFEILSKMPVDSPARTFYLLGYPYVTGSAAGKGYFIEMGDSPTLCEVKLTGAPTRITLRNGRELLKMPQLPKKDGLKSAELLYKSLEESTLAAGLYEDGDDLYLLNRRPNGTGRTSWTLAKFDGKRFSTNVYQIQTKAAQLTVIPGQTFAFLEKDRVKAIGDQKIPSVLLVSKRAIDEAAH